MSATTSVNRRDFIKVGATVGAGLVIGFSLPFGRSLAALTKTAAEPFAPSAWLQIDPDGVVTIWLGKSEMGQGVKTSLPMIIADELEAGWSTIRVVHADANPAKYGEQATGGSSSVRTGWPTLRRAGAQAREMLVAAAAQRWQVEPNSCRAENGAVTHVPTGRKLGYGELAATAAALPVPQNPRLKDPKDFRIIGKRLPRIDTPEKVDGRAVYGIDVKLPGMLYAAIARCPVFGGKMRGFDAAAAKAVTGVRDAFPIEGGAVPFDDPSFPWSYRMDAGVAVLAETTWAALQGRRALHCSWDEGPEASLSSAQITRMLKDRAAMPGSLGRNDGDALRALARGVRKLEADYEVPYLAHAAMEPMNCTADVHSDRCEIWAPTQVPDLAQGWVANLLGLPRENIILHVTLMGGGFGRRLEADYILDAVRVSKLAGAPVMIVWTREDDMQHDWYRPASYHRLSASLDAHGRPIAWMHRVAAPSVFGQKVPQFLGSGAPDEEALDGAADLPYAIPNLRVEYCLLNTAVPLGWWRSVYASQNAFANECFVDELAHAAAKDPRALRRALLAHAPRHRGVLELAAEKAGWGKPLPAGRFRGIAVHKSFGTYVAEVAEVSVNKDSAVRVHRVVCAVDCGIVVNPAIVEAQMESGIVFGLSAALRGAITIENGRVKQSNFHDYPVLRISEMPAIEVSIVPSTEPPSGVGEPAVPPIAPAVANAVFRATGKRVRKLPIEAGGRG